VAGPRPHRNEIARHDLEKCYDQAFDYWSHIVPKRPPYVILCNFDEFWIYDFNNQLFDPVERVAFACHADVLVKVARCFGPEPDPAAELEEFALDLVLADLASVERRLEIVAKEARAGKKDAQSEHDVLTVAKEHLDGGKELRTLNLEPDQRALLMGVFPVTMKPAVYVANAADELLPVGGEPAAKVVKLAKGEGAPAIILSARLEAELGELDPAEQAEMRAGYGIDESGLGRIARAVWEVGGLITYFTAPSGRPESCESKVASIA